METVAAWILGAWFLFLALFCVAAFMRGASTRQHEPDNLRQFPQKRHGMRSER